MGSGIQFQFQDSASEFSSRRRRRLIGQARNVCPHMIDLDVVSDDAGRPALHYQPAFETEAGTLDWWCMRCGLRVSENGVGMVLQHMKRALERDFSGTVKRLFEAQEKTTKLIEKVNRLGGAP